uniref:ZC3H15/TMA46 family C-terminal domain-containing protein n=1 Tax=Emiliania huxleyi TaxID=2903 RepID=A0A7S3SR53_EMIHU
MPAKGTPAWHAAQKAQAGGKPQVDKTFGMKNKKGKAVQAKFHTQNGGADNAAQEKRRAEMKKAEQEAMNALLFQEAKKKNEKNKEKAKKEEKKKEEDKEPTEMLARIEWLKKRTTTRTPVTLDRLKAWIERKKAKKEAERLAKLGNAKAALSSGKKLAGVTGRELFQVDSTLFVDDAEAAEDTFDERTGAGTLSDDDEEGGEEGAARAGGGEAAAGSHPGASVSDLVLGERVEGRYMGGKAWYGGVVRAVAADGTRSSRPECDGAARALYR